jgi:signal transduction histidine kinase
MRDRVRSAVAAVVAGLCLVTGAAGAVQPGVPEGFTGITLGRDDAGLFILGVDPRSPAVGMFSPGWRVVSIDDTPVEDIDDMDLDLYMSGEFLKLVVVDDSGMHGEMSFPRGAATSQGGAELFIGLGLLVSIAGWVLRGHAGAALRPLAVPLAAAGSAPMLVVPVWTDGDVTQLAAAILLPAAATITLADGFVARIAIPRARRLAVGIVAVAAVALPMGLLALAIGERPGMPVADLALFTNLGSALVMGLSLIPTAGLLVSTSRVAPEGSLTHSADRLPFLLAAVTPIVTAVSATYAAFDFGLALSLVWLLVAVVLLQSNARVETLRLQRDTVVAATEAERARLAADLHDDALQQMTVLVRRLDDRGAEADAAIARSIAERLRDVCGELRLPILDELGAGPALEWLVERVSQVSGGEVRLKRADTARPPANVELAFFRVAQEALANAINHGAPPIVVEYRAEADAAALSIVDHGPGIAPGSAASAPRTGHYGLLNMRQRAEQIGARLEFGRAADGGAAIGLRWTTA